MTTAPTNNEDVGLYLLGLPPAMQRELAAIARTAMAMSEPEQIGAMLAFSAAAGDLLFTTPSNTTKGTLVASLGAIVRIARNEGRQ